MIAFMMFAHGASLQAIAEVFEVPMSLAGKWIGGAYKKSFDGFAAAGAFWDALIDQPDPEMRAQGQRLVDGLAEKYDPILRGEAMKQGKL